MREGVGKLECLRLGGLFQESLFYYYVHDFLGYIVSEEEGGGENRLCLFGRPSPVDGSPEEKMGTRVST